MCGEKDTKARQQRTFLNMRNRQRLYNTCTGCSLTLAGDREVLKKWNFSGNLLAESWIFIPKPPEVTVQENITKS